MSEPLSVYCRVCSAAPGTPCSNVWFGGEVRPHTTRILDSAQEATR